MFHQTLVQHAILQSRAAVREVASQARKWAIAQSGPKHTRAQRSLRSHANQEHTFDDPDTGTIIKALNYDNQTGHSLWFHSVRTQPPGEYLPTLHAISLVQLFDESWQSSSGHTGSYTGLIEVREPHDSETTLALVQPIREFLEANSTPPQSILPDEAGQVVYTIADLLRHRTMILVAPWQADRHPHPAAIEAASRHRETIDLAIIDHASHRAISRELSRPEDIVTWTQADLMLLVRPENVHSHEYSLLAVPTEPEACDRIVFRHARNMKESLNFYIAQELMYVTMALSANQATMITSGTVHPIPSASTEHQMMTLQDKLAKAQSKLDASQRENSRLTDELRQLGAELPADDQPAELNVADDCPTDTELTEESPASFAQTILDHGDIHWPHLTVMDSFQQSIEEFDPDEELHEEFIKAIDSIHKIALALHNTKSRRIGNWRNFFAANPNWTYHDRDDDSTMVLYGDHREFDHQNAQYRISRHITLNGQSQPAQIYFDIDHTEESEIMLAYAGPMLPSAEDA